MRSSARRDRSRGSDRVRRRGSLARPAARGRCPDALRTGQTRGTVRPNRRLSGHSSVPGRAAASRTSGAPKCCAPLRISAPPLAGFAGRAGARPAPIRSIFDTNTEAAPVPRPHRRTARRAAGDQSRARKALAQGCSDGRCLDREGPEAAPTQRVGGGAKSGAASGARGPVGLQSGQEASRSSHCCTASMIQSLKLSRR